MMNDDSPRQPLNNNNNNYAGNSYGNFNSRSKPMGAPKYQDNKNQNYTPSMSFGHQGAGYNAMNQQPRRRTDRFKREALNYNERIVHQNDIIIRLLKEIRDRLPPPPPGTVSPSEDFRNTSSEAQSKDSMQEASDTSTGFEDQSDNNTEQSQQEQPE
jgi:hypothetical protein